MHAWIQDIPSEVPDKFLGNQHITHGAVWKSLEKEVNSMVASRRGSIPVFLRKPRTTCDFPGLSLAPVPHPSGSALAISQSKLFVILIKIRKVAKIRNRYIQVPHLTQDSTWESDKNTNKHHKQEPRGQPFPTVLFICNVGDGIQQAELLYTA